MTYRKHVYLVEVLQKDAEQEPGRHDCEEGQNPPQRASDNASILRRLPRSGG